MTQPTTIPTSRQRAWMLRGIVLGVLAVCVGVCVWLGAGGPLARGVRLDGLWAHHGFVRTAAICFGSMLGLAMLCVWTIRLARRVRARRGRMGGEAGTVLLEFVLVMCLVLPFAAIMAQSSLLMGGYLSVNYASYCATRAAIVYIPLDLNSEPRNCLASYDDPTASEKCYQVWNAAVWAVMPVGNGSVSQRESDRAGLLRTGIDRIYSNYGQSSPNWVSGLIGRKLGYAEDNTTVRILPSRSATGVYGEHEDITVEVSHRMVLTVPYASRLLAMIDDTSEALGDGNYTVLVELPTTLTNEGADDRIDIEEFPDDDENT